MLAKFFIAIIVLLLLVLVNPFEWLRTDSSLNTFNIQDEFDIAVPDESGVPSTATKNSYFGDLHVHTKHSFDAFIFGVTASPDDAYRYAKGEPIKHPYGFDMQINKPLDFYAVTDHGLFMGMLETYADPNSAKGSNPNLKPLHDLNEPANMTASSIRARGDLFGTHIRSLVIKPHNFWHPNVFLAWFTRNTSLYLRNFDYDVHRSAWEDVASAAANHYVPGEFTTFVGYEFTASTNVESGNLHRNVIFRGSDVPIRPFSRIDSLNPEDLWGWMDKLRAKGIDSLAMPHNSNGGNGQMFEVETFTSSPISTQYSQLRMRNEPVIEITQVKGTSETHPSLSPEDEWADFEIMDKRVGTRPPTYSMPAGGYARDALLRGLTLDWNKQGNPYAFGFIGSSDSHTGAGSYEEANYWSKVGLIDGLPELRGSIPLSEDLLPTVRAQYLNNVLNPNDPLIERSQGTYVDDRYDQWGASGLAGVWAEKNTRSALFDAIRRKETFATSGPRITLRFFAGYDLQNIDLNHSNAIEKAYASGVPMGATIFNNDGQIPRFIVWANRAFDGAPLQRVQIVKGWIDQDSGAPQEEIYDVVCSDGLQPNPTTHRCPSNRAKVNLNNCLISKNAGDDELKTIWKDPDFDSETSAFYYVRVLENPSCRWSSWEAVKAGYKPKQGKYATIQERAWSSPIWYIPTAQSTEL